MERRGLRTERGDLNRGTDVDRAAQVELAAAERMQTGAERMKAQAREWRIAHEQAKQQALAAERARQQEQERQESERKAQEKKRLDREIAERWEQSRSRGPGLGR